MYDSETKLMQDIAGMQECFTKTMERIIRDFRRQHKIMEQSDRRQRKEYDELQRRLDEVEQLKFEIEETQKEVVFTMGAIGESRSKETGNHVARVAEYSKMLARYYGLPNDEVEMLGQASPMHDIGKVAIADSILNKPGKLTDQEFEVMKNHAILGHDLLCHSNRELLNCAAIVAFEHHEKWDGTGYPRGLSGEDIHIYGRITALADVFDALGNDRCYKKAWPDNEIFDHLKQQRGLHFEPQLIDIFFDRLDEFMTIRATFTDTIIPSIPTSS